MLLYIWLSMFPKLYLHQLKLKLRNEFHSLHRLLIQFGVLYWCFGSPNLSTSRALLGWMNLPLTYTVIRCNRTLLLSSKTKRHIQHLVHILVWTISHTSVSIVISDRTEITADPHNSANLNYLWPNKWVFTRMRQLQLLSKACMYRHPTKLVSTFIFRMGY